MNRNSPAKNKTLLGIALLIALFALWWFQFVHKPGGSQKLDTPETVTGVDVGETGTFSFPFLGNTTLAKTKERHSAKFESHEMSWELEVFRAQDGRILRFQYANPESRSYELPVERVQSGYKSHNEQVYSFAPSQPGVNIPSLLSKLCGECEMSEATRFNATYVTWSTWGGGLDKPQDVFIVNVYDVKGLSSRLPDVEQNRRVRFVFDSKGELLLSDNFL